MIDLSQQPVLRPMLPRGVLVKYENWRAWLDDTSGQEYIEWSIRLTCVPLAFADFPVARERSFFAAHVGANNDDLASFVYSFTTFACCACVEEREALEQAIREGTIDPLPRVEGCPPARFTRRNVNGLQPFLRMLEHRVREAEKQYNAEILRQKETA